MVRQAVAALNACNSYEEADAVPNALYPNLDNAKLRTYMQQALFISDILGQDHARARFGICLKSAAEKAIEWLK